MNEHAKFWFWIAALAVFCLFLGAVLASAALPAVAAAEETPGRRAVGPMQTCSRPSSCETDAAKRARAARELRLRGEELNRLYRPHATLDRHYRPHACGRVEPHGGGL
jgi:hypothetical protein